MNKIQRKFHCKDCDKTFWESAAIDIAEEYVFAECPECRLAVGLYQMSLPLLNKRFQDWGAGEWVMVGIVAFLGYQGYKALSA